MRHKITACLLALLVSALACVPGAAAQTASPYAPAPAAISMIPGTLAVDPAISAAVLQAVQDSQESLPAMRYLAITAVTQAAGWQLVSVAGLQGLNPDGTWHLAENGAWFGLVMLQQLADGSWTGAAEGSDAYARLLAAAPGDLLSPQARLDLSPARGPVRAPAAGSAYRFPWQAGSQMLYGSLGVHAAGFAGWVSGWSAVDFVSDGNTALGHAPNRLLASAAGTIGAVCNDGTSVAIRMDYAGAPQFLYLHLQDNSLLRSGTTFAQGDQIGQLRVGAFNAACGWGQQDPGWFHVHFAFPAAPGSLPIENWVLNLSDQLWHNGAQTIAPGNWLTASMATLAAPDLVDPPADAVEAAGYSLNFTWSPVSGATAYQIAWSGGPYTNTQPLGWFSGTAYDVGQVAPGSYTWRVRARNSSGAGPWSASRTLTISPVQIVQALTITPTEAAPAQPVTATFKLTNRTDQTLELPALTVRVRASACHDPSCAGSADFPADGDLRLAPGQTYTYSRSRAFSAQWGGYQAAPAYEDTGGVWHEALPGGQLVTFAVDPIFTAHTYLPLLMDPDALP